MKNRWALRLAALTLISCLAMSGVSLAVEPGSASDPLVTLSYLNDVFLGQIMTKVDQKIAARNSQLLQQSGGAGGMSGVEFAVVTLSKGQVLTGDIGCEVMLRVGTASCVSPSNPGLIDETTAASLNNGGALAANHLYMMRPGRQGRLRHHEAAGAGQLHHRLNLPYIAFILRSACA